jgi:hypothetical protein
MNEWMNIIAKRELDEDEIQKILGPLLNRRAERKLKEQGIINKPKKITPKQRNVMVGQNAPSMVDIPAQDTDSLLAEAGQTAQNLKVAELQRQLGPAPTTAQNVPSAPNLPAVSSNYENVQGAPRLPSTPEERQRIAAEAAQQSQKDIKAGKKQQKKDAKATAKQQKKDAKAQAAMPRNYTLEPKQQQSSFRPRQQTGRLRPKNQPNVQQQPNVPVEATSVSLPVKQRPPNRQAQAAQERAMAAKPRAKKVKLTPEQVKTIQEAEAQVKRGPPNRQAQAAKERQQMQQNIAEGARLAAQRQAAQGQQKPKPAEDSQKYINAMMQQGKYTDAQEFMNRTQTNPQDAINWAKQQGYNV